MTKYSSAKKHDPIDESVQVPAAIRAAAARSSELHKQVYETTEPETPPATPETPPATPETPPATPPAAATPEPPPAQTDGVAEWEQRYNSLKGRYDKDQKTLAGLNSRISQLEGIIASAAATPAAPAQARTPDLTFKPVTQEDKDNYGEEFLDVAARAAAERFAPEIRRLNEELNALKGTVSNVADKTEADLKRDMFAYLDGEYSDWRTLNRDPRFVAWTRLPDPFSGAIRMDMMRDAFAKGDAPRVLRFFQGFLSDEAATGPAKTTQPELPSGKVPLESLAAPGRARAPVASETPQTPGEKETITHAQISAFYLAVQKGHYKGNEAEKDRLEKMIFEAQAEGRVV